MNKKNVMGLLDFIEKLKEDEKIKINLEEKESKFFTIIKYIFLNKNIIHDKLYKEDIIISLNSDEEINISNDISCILPLTLLILNSNFTDFSFSIDFILKINDLREKEDLNYEKVIISKILLSLIGYYKGLDEFYNNSNENKEKIEKIKKENNDIINNNTRAFNQFDLNIDDIKSKNIKEIFIALIKNNNHISLNIIKQLHLDSLLNTINNKEPNKILEEILNNFLGKENYNESNILSKDDNNSSKPTINLDKKEEHSYNQNFNILDMHKKEKSSKYTVEFIKQIGQFLINIRLLYLLMLVIC